MRVDYTFSLKPKLIHIKDNKCKGNPDKDKTMHRRVIFNPAHVNGAKDDRHIACKDCGLQFMISISNKEINIWEEKVYMDLTEFGVPKRKENYE